MRRSFWPFLIRWLHVICGVMWIGLLWYFNFVSTPTMPKIPDELTTRARPLHHAGSAVLVPLGRDGHDRLRHDPGRSERLSGAGHHARCDRRLRCRPRAIIIGIGMWLGTIMWFNVWFMIWPNQQKALNIGGKYPDLAAAAKGGCGARPRASSAASTRCSRSPCCSAWSRRRTFSEAFAICHRMSRPGNRAAFSLAHMNADASFAACDRTRAPPRSRPLFLRAVRARRRARRYLFALYAFNHEIARVAETVREPMMGEIGCNGGARRWRARARASRASMMWRRRWRCC